MLTHLQTTVLLACAVPCAIAAEPGFYLITPPPGGGNGEVVACTAAGEMAVGYHINSDSMPYYRGFVWSAPDGMVEPQPPGLHPYSVFTGVSSLGLVITGFHLTSVTQPDTRAFVWNVGSPVVTLPLLAGYARAGSSIVVSGDGLVVTGHCQDNSIPRRFRAFRWTAVGGLQTLPYAGGGHNTNKPYAISRDGTTIVGESGSHGSGVFVGFVWTASTGTMSLAVGGPNRRQGRGRER